ncbi:high-affinity nickel transport protein [Chaetomium sp. MPI-CAGE-AT-0009]|nr:high-affinity nickel transport protein [Chaetomium sp. MPI-CAGE-AT-0009]
MRMAAESCEHHDGDRTFSSHQKIVYQTKCFHERLPGIRRIPFRSVAIIALIALANIMVWAAAAIVLRFYPSLTSNAVLSYTLGLRHAFDADHISAIDLMTRRLLAAGQKPVAVGTFFSLGHSTIVIITTVAVAATTAAISSRFDSFGTVGGIIGKSVSATFLILLGLMNGYILYRLIRQMQKALRLPADRQDEIWKVERGGFLFRILKRLFRIIDRSWKMYPLGILFGLGFDTSTEIALLGISSTESMKGTSIWVILIFPALFTAGMCLLDTADGALMLALYVQPGKTYLSQPEVRLDASSSAGDHDPRGGPEATKDQQVSTENEIPPPPNHRDPVAFLYFSIVLTSMTVVVAIVIGIVQLLSLVLSVADPTPTGPFWDGVETAGRHYDVIGGGICGGFLVIGGLSVPLYRPWRRWVSHSQTLDPAPAPTGSERSGNNTVIEIGEESGKPRDLDTR